MLVRILEMPPAFPRGFHFGSGQPVVFLEVDWFHLPAGHEGEPDIATAEGQAELTQVLRGKIYWKPDRAYLVLHPTHPFTINYTGGTAPVDWPPTTGSEPHA